jgi:hypothetical protein
MRAFILAFLFFTIACMAQTFVRHDTLGEKQDAMEAMYRLLHALDIVKRQGICGNNSLVDANIAAIDSLLALSFTNWTIDTQGFSGVFNRSAYLAFFKYIAVYASVGMSQHAALDTVVEFQKGLLAPNPVVSLLQGRFLEFGIFRDASGVPQTERSISDYLAEVVWVPGTSVLVGGHYAVSYYNELGNSRWYPEDPHSFDRNFCPPNTTPPLKRNGVTHEEYVDIMARFATVRYR